MVTCLSILLAMHCWELRCCKHIRIIAAVFLLFLQELKLDSTSCNTCYNKNQCETRSFCAGSVTLAKAIIFFMQLMQCSHPVVVLQVPGSALLKKLKEDNVICNPRLGWEKSPSDFFAMCILAAMHSRKHMQSFFNKTASGSLLATLSYLSSSSPAFQLSYSLHCILKPWYLREK